MPTLRLPAVALCALFVALLFPGLAAADIVSLGAPQPVGSWAQEFQVHSVGNFDLLAISMTSVDSDFLAPGFLSFSTSGWTSSYDAQDPDYAQAAGPTVELLNVSVHFSGEPATPLSFDVKAWLGAVSDATLKEFAHLSWDSHTWTITYDRVDPHCVAVAPLPGALLLLGAGLVRLTAYARRRQ